MAYIVDRGSGREERERREGARHGDRVSEGAGDTAPSDAHRSRPTRASPRACSPVGRRRSNGGSGGAVVWDRWTSGARLARALSCGGTRRAGGSATEWGPPKLGPDDLDFLQQALDQGPRPYGLPVTVWSVRDLQALVQRERGIAVSVFTLHRTLQALGYRYRRPRHDLRHRQDAEAVAAAKRVLDWLQKKPTCARTIRC
jgi:transposase